MGFWGFLVAAKMDEPTGLTDVLSTEDIGGGWRLFQTGGSGDPGQLAQRLSAQTGQPALAAFVLDSDCAVLAGATSPADGWQIAVHPATLEDYGAPTDDFLDGQAAVDAALGWSRAAGFAPDPGTVATAIAAHEVLAEETTTALIRVLSGSR